MAKRCTPRTCNRPRSRFWKKALGVDWFDHNNSSQVSAGEDQTIDAGDTIQLAGSGPSGSVWTTSGTGTFDDDEALNAVYTPSDNDIALGSIVLTLTSGSNSNSVTITFELPDVDYSLLTGLEFLGDFTGLVTNTNNSYGTVDGSGNITALKSLAPSPTGRDFASNGTAPTLSGGAGVFGGAGRLRASTSTTWANFMHFNATINNLSWTVHKVVKIGTSENPGANYGLLGNNATSSVNKGIYIFYSDSGGANNRLNVAITKGTSNVFIASASLDDTSIANRLFVLSIEYLHSLSLNSRIKVYINGILILNISVRNDNNSPVTAPSFEMEIGGCGNATIPLVGSVREVSIQSAVSTATIRRNHIWGLIKKHSVIRSEDSTATDNVFNVYDLHSDGKYYLPTVLCQNPAHPEIVVQVSVDKGGHLEGGVVVIRRDTTSWGRSLGAKATIHNGVNETDLGMSAGYGLTGRLLVLVDSYAGSETTPSGNTIAYSGYSDDDGSTWTFANITSSIPSDGLNGIQFPGGSIIRHNGYLIAPYFKFTGVGSVANSANYILKAVDDGGVPSWSSKTVRAVGATYINEGRVLSLGGSNLLYVARHEVTNEFRQYLSTDDGETWTDQGDLTLGETIGTPPAPCELQLIEIDGTPVAVIYYGDRVADYLKAVYGLPANIISSGVSGWDLDTKTLLRQITTTDEHFHYGSVCHLKGKFDGIASWMYDPYPQSGGTTNAIHTFTLPTWHYGTVKTALGI